MNMASAQELRRYIAFGLQRLPDEWRLPFATDEPGADTTTSIRLQAGPSDVRTLVCYPSSPSASIDVSAQHTHLDEFCRMPYPRATFSAVESTITDVPDSTCHIVSRGKGADNYGAEVWQRALMGSRFHPFFTPWTEREGRDEDWYEREEAIGTVHVAHFAPNTWEEAIAGPGTDSVIPMEWASGAMQQERRAAGGGTIVAGLDVARYGQDKTAIVLNSDADVVAMDQWQGLSTTETTARVLKYIRDHKIQAIAVDDTGVGGGVTDELRDAIATDGPECLVIAVNNGETAHDAEHFHNRVSETWWGMREAFDPDGPLPLSLPQNHELSITLVNQTQGRRYKYDRTGEGRKWVFRSGETTEGEHIPSPDLADALALSLEAWRMYWAHRRAGDKGRQVYRPSFLSRRAP